MSTEAKKDSGPATVGRVSRRVECLSPGKDLQMPDMNASKYAIEETRLENVDESKGFNPYRAGVLHKK